MERSIKVNQGTFYAVQVGDKTVRVIDREIMQRLEKQLFLRFIQHNFRVAFIKFLFVL